MQTSLPATSPETLHVLHPADDAARISAFAGPVLVGRDGSCDLRLDDDRIAPRHAEIYRVGDMWWVRDLDSADGTYLDEEYIDVAPVVGPSTLQLGTDGPTIWLDPRNQ